METFTGNLDFAFSLLSEIAKDIKVDIENPAHKKMVSKMAKNIALILSTFTLQEIEYASAGDLEALNALQVIFTAIQQSDTPDAQYFMKVCMKELGHLGQDTNVFIERVNNSANSAKVLQGGGVGPKSILGLLFVLMFISHSINVIMDPSSVITVSAIISASLEFLPFHAIKDIISRLSGYKVEDYVPSSLVLDDGVVKQDPKTLEQGNAWESIRINAETLERNKENARALMATTRPVQEGYTELLAKCANGGCGTSEETALAQAAVIIVEAKNAAPQAKVAETALSTEYAKATAELAVENARWNMFSDPAKIATLTHRVRTLSDSMNATGMAVSILGTVADGLNPKVLDVVKMVGEELKRQAGEHGNSEAVIRVPSRLTPSGRTRRVSFKSDLESAVAMPNNSSQTAIAEFKPAVALRSPFPTSSGMAQLVTPVLKNILDKHPGATFDTKILSAMTDVTANIEDAVSTVGTAGTVVDTKAIADIVGQYFPSKNNATTITPKSFFVAMATEEAAKKAYDNAETLLGPLRAERARILDENFVDGVKEDLEHVVNGLIRMGFNGTREEASKLASHYLTITRQFNMRPNKQNDLYASGILSCLRPGGRCPKVKISDLNAKLHDRDALLRMNFRERLNHASGNIALAGVVLTLTYVGVAVIATSIESAGMIPRAAGVAAMGLARRVAGPPGRAASPAVGPRARAISVARARPRMLPAPASPLPAPLPAPAPAPLPAPAPAPLPLPAPAPAPAPLPVARAASPVNPNLIVAQRARAAALAAGNSARVAWYNAQIARMPSSGGKGKTRKARRSKRKTFRRRN